MSDNTSIETRGALKGAELANDTMNAFVKQFSGIPFGMKEQPKPKDPFVVPLKRGGKW